MRVSQKLDYVIKTLVLLANKPQGTVVRMGDLATSIGLPRRFVELQVSALDKAGIVVSKRGPSGGTSLARHPRDISVLQIVEAVEGQVVDIPHQPNDAVVHLWDGMSQELTGYLASVSLGDLARKQKEYDRTSEPMYYI